MIAIARQVLFLLIMSCSWQLVAAESLTLSDPDCAASFRNLASVAPEAWQRKPDSAAAQRACTALVAKLARSDQARAELAQWTTNAAQEPWLDRFATLWQQVRREQLATCPPIAFVTRRDGYGMGGAHAVMFAQKTGVGAAIMTWNPAQPDQAPRAIFTTATGFVWDLAPSSDGQTLLFTYKEAVDQPFHIWRIRRDGSGLKQLTSGRYHDFNPVFYPDGRIVFCSTRVEAYSMCQDYLASVLYTCDADGGDLRRVDFTTICTVAPAILPDGRIVCTRWEYQDKGLNTWEGLWTINPDGRRLQLYYGNTLIFPNARYGARPVPGTDEVLVTMTPHHHPPRGDIAVIDRKRGIENPLAMRKVTFETNIVPTVGKTWLDYMRHGDANKPNPWAVCDPWPLRDGVFLASFGRAPGNNQPGRNRLCLAHYDGTRFPLWDDGTTQAFYPVSLAATTPPRAIPGKAPIEAGDATVFVQDVYRGLEERGVQRGEVASLRVIRQQPKRWNTEGPRVFDHYPLVGAGTYYVKDNLGEVPVRADGSVHVTVPSNVELFFIALDKQGRELQRMGSVMQCTTGETVSCIGCHESRDSAPPAAARYTNPSGKPDRLTPPPWGTGAFDYVRHVQPVLDRNCVSCHAGRAPAAGMDLSGDKTRFFNMSFEALTERGVIDQTHRYQPARQKNDDFYGDIAKRAWVSYYFINQGPSGVFPAKGSGSYVSKLTRLIESGHGGKVNVPDQDRRALYAWIDSNANYYATWDLDRPHTAGGRDTWHRFNNGRITPEPWVDELRTAWNSANCTACHGAFGDDGRGWVWRSRNDVNLTRPENSRILNAHLARAAGGMGIGGNAAKDAPVPVFATTNDATYRAFLAAIEHGRDALRAKPSMDMPGAVAVPQERDFGKTFSK